MLSSSSLDCTPHRVAQVVRVSHVIHACGERHSSTLSSPFHPTSSSSHSPSISCSPCCSFSTSLRTEVTLRTPPKKRWGLLTSATSAQPQARCATSERCAGPRPHVIMRLHSADDQQRRHLFFRFLLSEVPVIH